MGQKLTEMPSGSSLRAAVVFQLPDSVAGILPLGYEYVPVAIVGQRADVRHQPVSTRNGELVGDRAIEDLPSRFDSHLRILIDGKLPLGICRNVGCKIDHVSADQKLFSAGGDQMRDHSRAMAGRLNGVHARQEFWLSLKGPDVFPGRYCSLN